MKNHLIIGCLAALLLFQCTADVAVNETPSPDALIAADSSFSALSAEKGIIKAFVYYADDELVQLKEGQFPVVGKEQLIESYKGLNYENFNLTWEPLKAEIANSGELGYTYGQFTLVVKDSVETTSTGYYMTVWKKQADGNWKYVIDGGVQAPIR